MTSGESSIYDALLLLANRDRFDQRIDRLRSARQRKRDMAILVVEPYFEWARDIADDYAVMDRGAVVLSGARD